MGSVASSPAFSLIPLPLTINSESFDQSILFSLAAPALPAIAPAVIQQKRRRSDFTSPICSVSSPPPPSPCPRSTPLFRTPPHPRWRALLFASALIPAQFSRARPTGF
jgi:hypothetical protein